MGVCKSCVSYPSFLLIGGKNDFPAGFPTLDLARKEPLPERLVVRPPSSLQHCGGIYARLSLSEACTSTPVWKKLAQSEEGEDKPRFLYRGRNGMWYIDSDLSRRQNFECNQGFIRSAVAWQSLVPEACAPAAEWQTGGESGERWQTDPDISVRDHDAVAGLPDHLGIDVSGEPVWEGRLYRVSLQQLQEDLELEDWPVNRYLQTHLFVMELQDTMERTARGLLRRASFKLPMPDDIPETIVNLLGLPNSVLTKAVYLVKTEKDRIILLSLSNAEGVMFADSFCLSSTTILTPHASGGVQIRTWAQARWKEDLPLMFSIATAYIDYRMRLEVAERAPVFAAMLDGHATCTSLGESHPAELSVENGHEQREVTKSADVNRNSLRLASEVLKRDSTYEDMNSPERARTRGAFVM